MIKLIDLLTEGVQDKGIFKAVFMAGGPGSGKTYVAKQLFGIPDTINVSVTGMKMINQDKELKFLLKKFGFDPAFLDKFPDELFRQLTDPSYEDYSGFRDFTKQLAQARKEGYMRGKLGMIIDGTGHKFSKIKAEKALLEKEGYDTHMVFVNTSLEVAQARNKERDRVLPEKIVKKSWTDTRKNLGGYKALFKGNFALVDNSKFLSPKEARQKFGSLVKGHINKWVSTPIKNPIGRKWVEDQKKLKQLGVDKKGAKLPVSDPPSNKRK